MIRLPSPARLRRLALWLAGLFLLLVLAGFFIVPPVAKSLIVKQASKALGRFGSDFWMNSSYRRAART